MSGANLTNVNASNFTPFAYFGNVTSANVISTTAPFTGTTLDAFKALPVINLGNSKSAIKNTILVTAYDAAASTTSGFYVPGSKSVSIDLYKLIYMQIPQTVGDTTELKCIPVWTKDQEITVKDGEVTKIENLWCTSYKLVPTALSTFTDAVLNVAWYDEPSYITMPYVKGEYGVINSILPPEMYVNPAFNFENVIYPA